MLTEDDRTYLESQGFEFEVLPEDGKMFSLIISGYRMPAGYRPEVVDLLLRLPAGFPDAAPDMWWVNPEVAYLNGTAPPATQVRETHHERTWQRWSRHLAIGWRPGIDNLQTYLRLIRTDLEQAAAQAA